MDHNQLWVLLRPLTKDDDINELVNILTPCIKEQILAPRYDLLAMLDILFDAMKEDYEPKILKHVRKQITDWLLRWDLKFWKIKETIPRQIDDILKRKFNKTAIELLGKYAQYFPDDFESEKSRRREKLIQEWISPKTVERIITSDKPVRKTQTYEEERGIGRAESYIPQHAKTVIVGEGDSEEEAKKLQELRDRIDVRFIKGLPENIKKDNESFDQLFKTYQEVKNIKFSDVDKLVIKDLWYGNPRADPLEYDNFLGYPQSQGKASPIKVGGQDIPPDISRIILQAYIIGLFTGVNVEIIYRNFLKVVKINHREYSPNREHIYNEKSKMPNNKVEEIISEVFKAITINPKINYIRQNWQKLKAPNINADNLIDFINNNNKINPGLAWKIRGAVKTELDKIQNKHVTIPKFADVLYKKFQKLKVGNKIKQTDITNNLSHEI